MIKSFKIFESESNTIKSEDLIGNSLLSYVEKRMEEYRRRLEIELNDYFKDKSTVDEYFDFGDREYKRKRHSYFNIKINKHDIAFNGPDEFPRLSDDKIISIRKIESFSSDIDPYSEEDWIDDEGLYGEESSLDIH